MNRHLGRNMNRFLHMRITQFHSKFLIIGAGTGGLSVAGQLVLNKVVADPKEITIVDPSLIHYYQPGFTKVGGGVYPISAGSLIEYDTINLTKKYKFINEEAKQVLPGQNKVITNSGEELTYDMLILSPGLKVNFEIIPGLIDLLEDKGSNVVSVYNYKYAQKTALKREMFKGGKALFTQPTAPIKCAGAPQKVLYLSDSYWKQHNIKADCEFFTPLPTIFGIKYYSDALEPIADQKKIKRHYKHVLTSFKNERTAIFKNLDNGSLIEHNFDFIHVVPPMNPPILLKNSPEILDSTGFVEVDATLRHTKFDNIYAIGDCNNLPNAKTAAAVFSQAPVLVANIKEKSNKHKYCGYSACPIFLGNKQLMLAEFSIVKDAQGQTITKPAETFLKGKQTKPSSLYYYLTYSLGYLYHLALIGRWFGKCTIICPISKKGLAEVIAVLIITTAGAAYIIKASGLI